MKSILNRQRKQQGGNKDLTETLLPHLFPLVPPVLEWLRDRHLLKSSESFITSAQELTREDEQVVLDALYQLASLVDKGPLSKPRRKRGKANSKNSFPSNDELNLFLLGNGRDIRIWYSVILYVMFNSKPKLIPNKFFGIDIAGNADLPPVETVPKVTTMVNGELSFSSLQVFGEFCSFIRDSLSLSGQSDLLKPVCQSIGPLLLDTKERGDILRIGCAANVLQFCVKHCYKIFDLPQKNSNWCVRGCRIAVRPKDKLVRFDKLQRDLSTFLEMKDKALIPAIPDLMRCYTIYEIALGILMRFECLPLGWKKELEDGQKQGKADWFNVHKITFVSEATVGKKMVGKRRYYIPSGARRLYREMSVASKKSELNEIVRELVDRKSDYVAGLEQFLDEFVAEIKFIAESDAFEEDSRKALGISSSQIETLMGDTLRNVFKIEQKLCSELEVLRLLPCEVQQKVGRAGVLCQILLRNADAVAKAYSEYGRSFRESSDMAQKLMAQSNNSKDIADVNLHFMEIFSQLKYTNKLLANSVDLALQAPMNYLPKQPLFFQRMQKYLRKKNQDKEAVYDVITDCLLRYKDVMESVNTNIGDKSPVDGSSGGQLTQKENSFFFSPFAKRKKKMTLRSQTFKSSFSMSGTNTKGTL